MVWRYYCDYCKKSGCSGGHIKKHEASCTNNPNRFCGMCNAAGLDQKSMSSLISTLGKGDNVGLDKLRDLAENCPACILSAIRQSKLQYYELDEDGFHGFRVEFDFKKEKELFWAEVNTETRQQEHHIF